ncbi:hypothetical protein FGSG_13069 [Fusarium graminearum PH-1]|uniref:hypothetical protein n=1 Tax=Gibberella zeae (strain ATCC MYA-4620 / CBS 123657 / FGSC 9075 / NRRL 31084 / PH-1) TaxID=229533 RepID=UPI00021F12E9|nr:hypothetical protein FGSG_13069 [Fusarium graminearum PH-1]ESU13348.1 hypothetical protein FGSG_13069 [Fusarium graminearum PH-1]|eukprot:XP_011326855.1 hypothetical protein FGSG_13069 [Fusarium graminearum PH-1]
MHADLDFCRPIPTPRKFPALIWLSIALEHSLPVRIAVAVRSEGTLQFLGHQGFEALSLSSYACEKLWVIQRVERMKKIVFRRAREKECVNSGFWIAIIDGYKVVIVVDDSRRWAEMQRWMVVFFFSAS